MPKCDRYLLFSALLRTRAERYSNIDWDTGFCGFLVPSGSCQDNNLDNYIMFVSLHDTGNSQ
jgi:hypothetical protein